MLGVIFVYEKLTNTATLWKLTSTSKLNIDLARNQKFSSYVRHEYEFTKVCVLI